ncbi:glycosyl hydrolase [Streptomyces sp. NPDC059396]|uniref:glycosyl hydrolase n=1 Tax=Streptomyces sp. NPDC059396 TaxID=3346819 RepID=UPI0036C87D86
MNAEADFRLDGFEPADTDSADAESSVWAGDLTVLAEHHTPSGSHSYLLTHDTSTTWGVPGEPQLITVKITRDLGDRTFTFESAPHTVLAFAQGWLIDRGCPTDPITQVTTGITPADELTVQTERKIRDAAGRYEVLHSDTAPDYPYEAWTMARDRRAVQDPVRVFLEASDALTDTYTVREGAFADEEAAMDWLFYRHSPLPQPPEDHGDAAAARSRAALTRSTGPTVPSRPEAARSAAPPAGAAVRATVSRPL